ncbi:hypothetical protein [Luedemannella helvata]|uniref:DUF3533 domain-containing protein n=1 Tax=Luedemannella helvata TaxID=349315 RepID=A0ABP4VU74_9ACTN
MTEPNESPPTPASRVNDALGSGDEPPGGAATPPVGRHAAIEPHDAPPSAGSAVDDAVGESDEPGPLSNEGRAPPGAQSTPANPLIWRGMWHVPHHLGQRFWHTWVFRAVVLLFGVLLLATAFIAAYVGGLHDPTPRDIPVAVVQGDQTATEVVGLLDERTELVDGRTYATLADARTALDRREVFAVLASDRRALQLTTSSAAGAFTAEVVSGSVETVAQAAGIPVTTTDAHPLSNEDSRGLVAFYLVVGLTLGGYLSATVLGLSLGTAPRNLAHAVARLAAFAAFALVMGFAGALVVGPILGIWTHHMLGLTLGGALMTFAGATITSALQGWLGIVGTGLAITLLVVLSNPGSGGVFAWPFLPTFFRGMHVWVPGGLGVDLIRAVAYFQRAAAGWPVTGLLLWSVAGILGTLAATMALGHRSDDAL